MTAKCIACGMPMSKPQDFAAGDTSKDYCHYCARPDGTMKSRTEVLDGLTAFIVRTQGLDPDAAKMAAQRGMASLPAWREK